MSCSYWKKVFLLLSIGITGAGMLALGQHHPLHLITNHYRGCLAISANSGFFKINGDTTIMMAPDKEGRFYLNTGASVEDPASGVFSNIDIFFDENGKLQTVSPAAAVTITPDRKGIIFNTSLITINPGKFDRKWYPSFRDLNRVDMDSFFGKITVSLIKGMTYNINQVDASLGVYELQGDSCHQHLLQKINYNSYIYFTVDDHGGIMIQRKNALAATANGSVLTFTTVDVTLDPALLSGGKPIIVGNTLNGIYTISKATKVNCIRGTVTKVAWYDDQSRLQEFHFIPL